MQFPENPSKRQGLWESFLESLTTAPLCVIIENGQSHLPAPPKVLTADEA